MAYSTEEKKKAYYERNKDTLRAKQRQRYYENAAREKARSAEWRKENRARVQEEKYKYFLKRNYGITHEIYESMKAAQGSCCKICKIKATELEHRLAVDHCHTTGKVRGLLCKPCNAALGLFKDSQETLLIAANYLKESKE